MQLCEDKNNFANIVILKYFYGNLTILPPNDTFINKKRVQDTCLHSCITLYV